MKLYVTVGQQTFPPVAQIMTEASDAGLTSTELVVLVAWLADSVSFDATRVELARRTGVHETNVSKAMSKLVDRDILRRVRKASNVAHVTARYVFTDSFIEKVLARCPGACQ